MTNFEEYMNSNTDYVELCKYYNSEDISDIYGVKYFEIKHSNALKWILQQNTTDYTQIRNLLKLIQKNNSYYIFFNSVNIDKSTIKKVNISREKYNIDLFITLEINNENYVLVIENKIESLIHDDQLKRYKEKMDVFFPSPKYKILYVFLHPGYHINSFQENIVNKFKYISITYQEIYDNILKTTLEHIKNDSMFEFILNQYIHSLSCYDTDNIFGLIITKKEKEGLSNLIKDKKFLKMIDSLNNNENNEYTNFYISHKSNLIQIFKKLLLNINDTKLKNKIKNILEKKSYILNENKYTSITKLLETLFKELLSNHTIDELNEITHLLSETDPLLILKQDIKKIEHANWYLKNPKELDEKYYILSSWSSKEYDELKNKINELAKNNPNIYGKIFME